VIRHDERKYEFILPDGNKTELSCLDSESIREGTEFVLSGGGYTTEKEAFQTGEALKGSLLITGAKLRIGVDAGKEQASGWMNPTIKENIFKSHGVKIISDVHGLSVYSENHPVITHSASVGKLVSPSSAEKFSSNLCELLALSDFLTNKQKLSLELYGASHFEKSDRARFLTLVLGVEALLEPDDRSDEEVELVDTLIKSVKDSELGGKEKQSIHGSLRCLYKDSISQTLRKMAEHYLNGNLYEEHSPSKFITKCYGARSKLVHTGTVGECNVNIGGLAANLNVFLSDLIQALVKETANKANPAHTKKPRG
jgi:hypothetical protein